MNIGETALASGISVKMIRHYEAIGLVPPPARTQGGYRRYNDDDLRRLVFIRHARTVGFATPQIRRLLSLWDDATRSSAEVRRLGEEHLQAVRLRIGELQGIASALQALIGAVELGERPATPRIPTAQRGAQMGGAQKSGARTRSPRSGTVRIQA